MTKTKHLLAWIIPPVIIVATFLFANTVFAQGLDVGLEPLSATGLGSDDPRLIAARIVRAILGLLGVVAFAYIVYGGVIWMTAGGRNEAVEKAQSVIVNAVIGLVIILSALAITQFVISRLAQATGLTSGDFTTDTGGGGPPPTFGGPGFRLNSVTPSGSVPIRNVTVQLAFSSSVDASTVANNILVRPVGSPAGLAGDFTTTGSTVRYVPVSPCPTPHESLRCFASDTQYEVIIGGGLRGTNGAFVDCAFTSCRGLFTTGSLVDTTPPSVVITYPDDLDFVSADIEVPVSVYVTDDAGVGLVEGLADDESFGTDAPTSNETIFYGSLPWDTTIYPLNSLHNVDVTATDIAGNSTEADRVRVTVLPAHCFNGETDTDVGETGPDCGGDATSEDYCGACIGDACSADADCASGFCVDGICVERPEILSMEPDNGAPGTYVTLSGNMFGGPAGTVTFLGDTENPADDTVGNLACAAGWSPSQVIVVVPSGTQDGPVRLTTATGDFDETDDDVGAALGSFVVNTVARPGICVASPDNGPLGTVVTLSGNGFGTPSPSSHVYFGSVLSGATSNWTNASLRATVPPLSAGPQNVTVWVNNVFSNPVDFEVEEPVTGAAPVIGFVDPESGPSGEYITVHGSNFGSAVGTIRFTNMVSGYSAVGDTNMPAACTGVMWTNTQVTVKVPEQYTNGFDIDDVVHQLRVQRADSVESDPAAFVVTAGSPGPGICALSPVSGPEGTIVQLFGERFGASADAVSFYNNVAATPSLWGPNAVTTTVPIGAQIGPVHVTVDGDDSNTVNFAVGACDPTAVGACGAGFKCCANTLSCIAVEADCAVAPPDTNYLFEFSTGTIPLVPHVLNLCSDASPSYSPSPWNARSGGNDVCVNALVSAYFNVPVAGLSLESVHVDACTAAGGDPCDTVTTVAGVLTVSNDHFYFNPTANLIPNTTYRVTIDDTVTSAPPNLEPMADSYIFFFKTRNDADLCAVDEVVVVPEDTTFTDLGNGLLEVNDQGDAVLTAAGSGGQLCVLTDLSGEPMQWSLLNNSGPAVASVGATNTATLQVKALGETLAGPVTAMAALLSQGLSGLGFVNVNFADPVVQGYWPNCGSACFGAGIGASFNVPMRSTGTGALTTSTVSLVACQNELCQTGQTSPRTISVSLVDAGRELVVTPATPFDQVADAGRYFRVTISGNVLSQNGVHLTGLNALNA
ncbi:IPT/TIG domain-containing protein, partial [Candidatus Uhrbacteria bacterium]|nr:IPT/TIG domain-containing protein [Candidatus Uhrbacteria bacterium]